MTKGFKWPDVLPKIFLIAVVGAGLSSCAALLNYSEFKTSGDFRVDRKNQVVCVLDIKVPPGISERNPSLSERIYNDVLMNLKEKGFNVKEPLEYREGVLRSRVFKQDVYSWFFRSDTYGLKESKFSYRLDGIDLALVIDITYWEPGTVPDNDYIEGDVRIFDVSAGFVKKVVSFKGFYEDVLRDFPSEL